jgi:uncharacterized membrane protein YbhN (UPF0104 family)
MHQSFSLPDTTESRILDLSDRLGTTGLYIFAFGAWLNKGIAIAGLAMMLLTALLNWKITWDTVKQSPLTWLTLSMGLYTLARTTLSLYTDPAHSELHLKDGLRFFYLCGFLLVAWYMAADQKRIINVFAVAFSGFMIARLWHFDWSFSSGDSSHQ